MVAVNIDFGATPSEAEGGFFGELNTTASKVEGILTSMTNYRAKENEIRAAIATPSPETEEAAWKAIIPQVQIINSFYEYSRAMRQQFVGALRVICKSVGTETVSQFQATTVKLMELIDFAVQFDNKKLTEIQLNRFLS